MVSPYLFLFLICDNNRTLYHKTICSSIPPHTDSCLLILSTVFIWTFIWTELVVPLIRKVIFCYNGAYWGCAVVIWQTLILLEGSLLYFSSVPVLTAGSHWRSSKSVSSPAACQSVFLVSFLAQCSRRVRARQLVIRIRYSLSSWTSLRFVESYQGSETELHYLGIPVLILDESDGWIDSWG